MIDAGVPVALATDFNPNAHCLDMPTAMNLACVTLGMTMEEALVGSTINAAAALGLGGSRGSLEVGKQGDCFVLDAPSWEHLVYQMNPPIADVFKAGVSSADALARPGTLAYWTSRTKVDQSNADRLARLAAGIPLEKMALEYPGIDPAVPHAPPRAHGLDMAGKRRAVRNALRYFPHEYC